MAFMVTPESAAASHDEAAAHVTPRLLYTVKQLELAVRAAITQIVEPHDLTVTQYTALSVLARPRPQTVSDLARHSFVRAQSMSEVIGSLEERKLVRRRRYPQDRKRIYIELTAKGAKLLASLEDDMNGLEDAVFGGLTTSQRGRMSQWLGDARSRAEHLHT